MEILILAALLGLIPAMIASGKGRSFPLWWLYGAALFIVALPHALIAAPNRAEVVRRAVASGTGRQCPHCLEVIPREARVCRVCSRDVEPILSAKHF